MRIGQFTDSFLPVVDGVGRVVYHYAAHLGERGHESYVIAPMQDTGYRGGYPFEIVDFEGMPLPNTPQYRTGMPILDSHYNHRIEKISLDIVHAHSPFIAGQEALRIAGKMKIPIIGTFHSKFYDDFFQLTSSKYLASLGTRYVVDFFSRCDEVWTVTNASAEVLHSYGYKKPVWVIPNGTAIRLPDPSAVNEVNEKYNLGTAPVLLYVGQINWKKNILRTLEAAALLRQSGITFTLVMAGIGPDRDEIGRKVEELGLFGQTIFTGLIQDTRILDGLYSRASLFVFPSQYDTAGLVVQEAACMGTPSVVIEGSCAAEVIQDRRNGFSCEDSTEALYDVMREALTSPAELEKIGHMAQSTIPVHWENVINQAEERYQALIERTKSSRQSGK